MANHIARGQSSLRVLIQDAQTGKPLIGATALHNPGRIGATADSSGRLLLPVPTADRYSLTCSFVGYQNATDSLTLSVVGDSITVPLTPEGKELEEVVVTSTRSNRSIDDIPTRIEAITGEELEEKANMRPGGIRMQFNESTGIQVQQTSPYQPTPTFAFRAWMVAIRKFAG